MKGFKTVKEFTYPREKGFTGSAGLTPVRGYMRGGKIERASVSDGNAGTLRDDPVTEVDRSPLGGRTELRPGYAKGGRNFIAGAIKKPGALRKSLGVKAGDKIPAGKLAAAAEKPGKVGRRARLAQTLRKMNRAEGGKVKKDTKVADDDRSFLEKLLGTGTAGKTGEKLAGRRRQIDDAVDAAERGYAKGGETRRTARRYGAFARNPLIGK
jgi:hypothetical protein